MRPAPNLKVKTRRRSRGEILGSWHLCQFLTPLPLYIPALQLSWFLGPRAIHVVVQRSSLSICSARRREGGWQQKVVATTREIVCFQRVPKTIRKTGGCRYVQIKVPQKEAAFPETCYCQFIQGSTSQQKTKNSKPSFCFDAKLRLHLLETNKLEPAIYS